MQRHNSKTLPFTAEQRKELLQTWNNMGRALVSTGHATPLFQGINIASNALYGGQTCDSPLYDRRLHAGNPPIAKFSPSCTTIPETPLGEASKNQQIIGVDLGRKTALSAGGHRLDPINGNHPNLLFGIRTSLINKGKGADGDASSLADRGPIPNLTSVQKSSSASTESNNVRLTTSGFGSTSLAPSSTHTFGTPGFGSTITSAFNSSGVTGSRSSPFALSGPSAPASEQFGGLRKPDSGPGFASLTTKGRSSIFGDAGTTKGSVFGILPASNTTSTCDTSSTLDAGNITSQSTPGLFGSSWPIGDDLTSEEINTLASGLLKDNAVSFFSNNCSHIYEVWISSLATPASCGMNESLIAAYDLVLSLVEDKKRRSVWKISDDLPLRFAYVQLIQAIDALNKAATDAGQRYSNSYSKVALAINVYLQAKGLPSSPEKLRSELSQHVVTGRRWCDLAGQSPILLSVYLCEADEIVQQRSNKPVRLKALAAKA